jgi:glycosyltransferase involved in cell wall biosynthesis
VSRILTITNNLKQASFRLRIEALRDLLAARGVHLQVEVRPRKLLARRRLWRSAALFDSVILQRKLLDRADMVRLRRYAKKIFYDVDDAVMYHNRQVGAVSRWRNWKRFKATARRVDVVVAGNEYLAEIFRKHGAPSATVLPTMVDPSHYRVKLAAPTNSPALVWIGSKSTLPYLAQLKATLKQAAQGIPGLRLITIADQTLDKSPVPTEHISWSVSTEADALIRGDIGIAPMPEDRWTLGKCGFKILQYMAAGLPVIASPIGANREIVVPGQTGLLAEDAEEWLTAINALCGDAKLREQMGTAGRRRVEEHFSLERAADAWVKLLS